MGSTHRREQGIGDGYRSKRQMEAANRKPSKYKKDFKSYVEDDVDNEDFDDYNGYSLDDDE